jgi:TRAP-type C4-dicarboxylate transport system substrate-binding protein
MLKRVSRLFMALAVVAAGVVLAHGQASAQTVWRFSNWVPPTHPLTVEVFYVWAKKVEEATHGRVKIQFVSALGNPPSHFDLVKDGVADVAMSVNSYTANRFVLNEGVELPFLAPNAMSSCIAYWDTYNKYFKNADEYKGVHLLGIWTHGPAHIFTRDKKLNTIADIEHLKMRVPGGIVNEIAKKLGTVPVFAPASQAYNVLSKGVADGIFFPTESVYNFKIGPVIHHALEIPDGLYRTSHYLIVNQAKWDALSPEDQKAINSVSGIVLAKLAGAMWDKADAQGKAGLLKLGTEFTVANPTMMKNLHAKLDGMTAEWVAKAKKKGVDGQAALDYYIAQVKANANAK